MAVRVVKLEPDPSVVKRVLCPSCGVTLEYLSNDVKCEFDRCGFLRATIRCVNERCMGRVRVPDPRE